MLSGFELHPRWVPLEYVKRSEAGNFNVPYWGKLDFKSKRIRLHDSWCQKMASYMEDEKKGQDWGARRDYRPSVEKRSTISDYHLICVTMILWKETESRAGTTANNWFIIGQYFG